MADKHMKILPDLSLHNSTGIEDLSFSGCTFFKTHFFFICRFYVFMSFVVIDYQKVPFCLGSHVCRRRPNYTYILLTYFLKRNLFATECNINVITVSKFTSGQCVWGCSIVAPHPIDAHWSSDHFVWERDAVYNNGLNLHKHIEHNILFFSNFLNSSSSFFF